jgi:ABC-type microcin C transport system permease subunit YejE
MKKVGKCIPNWSTHPFKMLLCHFTYIVQWNFRHILFCTQLKKNIFAWMRLCLQYCKLIYFEGVRRVSTVPWGEHRSTAHWTSLRGNRKPVWTHSYLLIAASINVLSSLHHVIRIMFMGSKHKAWLSLLKRRTYQQTKSPNPNLKLQLANKA